MHQGLLYLFVGWSDLSIEVALLKLSKTRWNLATYEYSQPFSVFIHSITLNKAKFQKNNKTHSQQTAQAAVLRQQQWSHLVLCKSHLRTTTKRPLICANQMTLNSHLLLNWAPVHTPSSFQQPLPTLTNYWQRSKSRHSSEGDRTTEWWREKELWCN